MPYSSTNWPHGVLMGLVSLTSNSTVTLQGRILTFKTFWKHRQLPICFQLLKEGGKCSNYFYIKPKRAVKSYCCASWYTTSSADAAGLLPYLATSHSPSVFCNWGNNNDCIVISVRLQATVSCAKDLLINRWLCNAPKLRQYLNLDQF